MHDRAVYHKEFIHLERAEWKHAKEVFNFVLSGSLLYSFEDSKSQSLNKADNIYPNIWLKSELWQLLAESRAFVPIITVMTLYFFQMFPS